MCSRPTQFASKTGVGTTGFFCVLTQPTQTFLCLFCQIPMGRKSTCCRPFTTARPRPSVRVWVRVWIRVGVRVRVRVISWTHTFLCLFCQIPMGRKSTCCRPFTTARPRPSVRVGVRVGVWVRVELGLGLGLWWWIRVRINSNIPPFTLSDTDGSKVYVLQTVYHSQTQT